MVTMSDNIFVTTDFCDLPSRGELYEPASVFYKQESIPFHDMTMTEEDMLANKTLVKNGVAFDRVMQSCLENPSMNVNEMTIPDKQALLTRLRINSYGPLYKISIQCPECNQRQDVTVDLQESFDNAIKFVKPISETLEFFKDYDLQRVSADTFSFITKKNKLRVVFRVGKGKDEHIMFKMEEKKRKARMRKDAHLEEIDRGVILDTFKMFIVSINDITDRTELDYMLSRLHSADTWHIREVYREVSCQIKLLTRFVCVDEESCGFEHDVEVPLTVNFFRHNDGE